MDEDDKDTPTETVQPLGSLPSAGKTSSEHRTLAGPSPSSSGVMGNYVRELRAEAKPQKVLLARIDTNTKAVLAMLSARKSAPCLFWWLICAVLAMALLDLIATLAMALLDLIATLGRQVWPWVR
jgi:hypothetical protein